MADIPNFPLGISPLPTNVTQSSIGGGLAQGLMQGAQINQGQQALNQQKALQQAQIQELTIKQVDSLLKTGMSYDGLLPSFWPTIATKMNQLSPDYKLDPNSPPSNLSTFAKKLSDISDGLGDKVVTPEQAHNATKQLIQSSFPPKVSDALGQDSGAAGPSGPSNSQGPQLGQAPQGMPMGAAQQGAGQAPTQQNPVADLLTAKTQYDKASQLIAKAPIDQQEDLRKQLDNSSLGQTYKQLLDNHFKMIDSQFTEGEQNKRNEFNQRQDTLRASASTFMGQSEQFKNVADNFSAFNHLMQLSDQMEKQGADTTATVNAEKTALLNFAQMAYPGTGRPGSPEMLEQMEKSGPYGTLIEQSLNKLDKGDIMTGKQIKGLRQAALALYQGRESQQSQLEDAYSHNIKTLGGDPNAFLKNLRPQSVHSTSKLFPTQSSDHDPIIGHVMETPKGKYQYIGGNKADKHNWAYVGDENE